jgi:peroxiredoxin
MTITNQEYLYKAGGTLMGKINLFQAAPEIVLNDFTGQVVKLSDYRNRNNVMLIFNRGFF